MLLTCLLAFVSYTHIATANPITLSKSPTANVSAPIPEAFVSFSIEFSSFPDFAGKRKSLSLGLPQILSQGMIRI
jgi:hypothetical protein